MKIDIATLRIVTPMFIGDAKQNPSAVPAGAVKSALRFWWRAMAWSSFLERAQKNEARGLQMLYREEGRLFGESAKENSGGQGCFLLAVTRQPQCSPQEERWPRQQDGSAYLAFGLLPTQETPHRQAILERINNETNTFELRMLFKRGTPDADVFQIHRALQLWGTLGGLGSRWRRGFGSVMLESLNGEKYLPVGSEMYQQQATALLTASTPSTNYPPFTAFSVHQRMKILATASSPRIVLDEVGKKYRDYRGPDSGLTLNEKMPFGLPLQGMRLDKEIRRASPLILHVHPLASNKYAALGLFLPADFHPQTPKSKDQLSDFYAPIEDFVS